MYKNAGGIDVITDDDNVSSSVVMAPPYLPLPVVFDNEHGDKDVKLVTHLNSESFQVGLHIGTAENSMTGESKEVSVIIIQMSFGEGGLFHTLALEEAEAMIASLQKTIEESRNGINKRKFEAITGKSWRYGDEDHD